MGNYFLNEFPQREKEGREIGPLGSLQSPEITAQHGSSSSTRPRLVRDIFETFNPFLQRVLKVVCPLNVIRGPLLFFPGDGPVSHLPRPLKMNTSTGFGHMLCAADNPAKLEKRLSEVSCVSALLAGRRPPWIGELRHLGMIQVTAIANGDHGRNAVVPS